MIRIDVKRTLSSIVPQNDWTHSEQLWVSGDKTHWNNQTMLLFVNTLPDMICIDVTSTLLGISHQNDWIHGAQVWVSGCELHWNNQVTPTCLLGIPNRMWLALIWCSIATWNYWTHSGQVCVSGYKQYWNNQIAATFINTRRDVMWSDVRSTLCHLAIWMIGSLCADMSFSEIMHLE